MFRLVLYTLLFCFTFNLSAQGRIIYESNFSNPSEMRGWVSSDRRGLESDLRDGNLQIREAVRSARHAVLRFAQRQNSITLTGSQTLSLRAAFTLDNIDLDSEHGEIRLGIFSSGGEPFNQFIENGDNPSDCTSQGFIIAVIRRDTGATLRLVHREGYGALLSNVRAFNTLYSSPNEIQIEEGRAYELILNVQRRSSRDLRIEASLQDVETRRESNIVALAPHVEGFDHIGIATFSRWPNLILHNISLGLE